jgi:predicted thioesterase
MAKPVPLGARGEAEERVTFETTLAKHHAQLPPVLSTPEMIRIMETACFHALMPYHDEGEINVGTAIHVEHRAACGIGALVKATAELESVDGRFYVMRVRAWADGVSIGAGTVHRAFVNLAKVMGKIGK